MAEPTLPLRLRSGRILALLIVILLVAAAVYEARPPRTLVIETGPVGGSYYQAALQYRDYLTRYGITVDIRPQPNSMEIVRNVANPASGVQAGFIAQDVSAMAGQPVATLGQIQLQPLFVFASAELGRRSVLDNLRGRRIVMPPADSATSVAAIRMFELYDITDENTSFTFLPLADAAAGLQAGRFDAGVFMLAPENAVIKRLASDSGLRLVPQTEARAISNYLPFLRPVMLPRGIYNIADAIPPYDTPLVAATVGVVVSESLHPFLAYALLEAMSALHRSPTFISSAGEFPTMVGAQLPLHKAAARYYESGLPWTYQDLPPWLASAVDKYAVYGAALLLLGVILLLITTLSDALTGTAEIVAVWLVRRIERRVSRTGRLSSGQRTLLGLSERLLGWSVADHAALAVIAGIRSRDAAPSGAG